MHGVDRAARRRRGDDGEQRRADDAEADFLAFHVAAGEAQRIERGGAVGFGPVAERDAGDKQDAHDGQDRPALTLVADHAAEHIGQACAEHEDGQHLDEVRQRGRVLERMRGVGVEEAAAIGAEHLDGDLRGDRADGDGLSGAFQRGGVDVRSERLRNALPNQKQCVDDADRHQDVERAAGDIDPEVANGLRRGAGKTADQCHREHDAGRRRQKVLMRQAEHLREVRHRALAAVVLPVGVGDEADRRVEGEVRRDVGLLRRIERQPRLDAHQDIKNEEAAGMKQQHADRIGQPVLLAFLIDAAGSIYCRLDRPQHGREERAFTAKDARHITTDNRRQCDDDGAVKQNLNPANDGHVTPH